LYWIGQYTSNLGYFLLSWPDWVGSSTFLSVSAKFTFLNDWKEYSRRRKREEMKRVSKTIREKVIMKIRKKTTFTVHR